MFDQDDETPTGGYWPSVADLFITLFIITIVILAVVFFISNNRGLGPLFGEIRKPTNELREVLGLPRIRETQSPSQVVAAVRETSRKAITRISELDEKIARLEEERSRSIAEIERLKALLKDPSGVAKLEEQIKRLEEEIRRLKEDNVSLIKRINELKNLVATIQAKIVAAGPNTEELLRKIEELEKENKELKRDSPSVVIGEKRRDFRFDSGSPVVKEEFSKALRNRIPDGSGGFYEPPFPQIAEEIIKRQERINTLEIIGHTDGVPLSTSGNLDQRLPELLAGKVGGPRVLSAGSNNDLGLLRALALEQQWLDYAGSYMPVKNREVLQRIQIRCYSAGQTILPIRIDDPSPADFRKNDPRARRIEMRLTRLGKVTSDEE